MRLATSAILLLLAATSTIGCRRHDAAPFAASDASTRPDSLGPGDLRIYNADSSVDLVLVGDRITAGLSDRVVADVRQRTDSTTTDSGVGGMIASIVKKTVASAIATRVVYPLAEVRDLQYQDGTLVFVWQDGRRRDLFTDSNVNGRRPDKSFRAADAARFVDAVRARKRELGL